jgi:hypothetical protein
MRRVVLLATASLAGSTLLLFPQAAKAQSPSPNVNFIAVKPYGSLASGTGVVVQGLGLGSCTATTLSELESQTVAYLNSGRATISEISPQAICGQIPGYETVIQQLASYVESHATSPAQLWGGIMLHEESGSPWNFSPTDYETLNTSVSNTMASTPGISWYYTEVFSCNSGCWTQSDYNAVIGSSYPAPQIVTSYMVQLTNGSNHTIGNLVTWSSNYSAPFNTESYDTGQINGAPYLQDFSQPYTFYWANQWQPT